jgi:Tfp pilus assembly protein FimT
MEVTIAIMILGILAAVAVPRFGDSVRGSRLRAAANQIASHVDYIRQVAINQGRTATLLIVEGTDRYQSTDVEFPDKIGRLIDVPVKTAFDSTFELSADFDSHHQLTFDFEGVPRVPGGAMQSGVISIGYDDQNYEIVITPGLGTTTVARRAVLGGTAGVLP